MADCEEQPPESVSEQISVESQQNHLDGSNTDSAKNSLEERHNNPSEDNQKPKKRKRSPQNEDTEWITNPKKVNWGKLRFRKMTEEPQEGESTPSNHEDEPLEEDEEDSNDSFWEDDEEDDEDGWEDDDESEDSESEDRECSQKRGRPVKNSAYKRFKPGASDAREVFLTSDMADYVDEAFSFFTKEKVIQEEILNDYPVPIQDILSVPEVDDFIPNIFKQLKSNYGKPIDANWQQAQQKVLNIMGPLSHLWRVFDRVKKGKGSNPSLTECLSLVEKIIILVGQAIVCFNYHRRLAILFYLTRNIKEAKVLMKSNSKILEKKKKTLFGAAFYKSLCRLATVGKKSKAISDEFGSTSKKFNKQKPSGRGRGRGNGKPFRGGPSPGRGGGGQKSSRGRGGKSFNKGELLFSDSQTCKRSSKSRSKSSVPGEGYTTGHRAREGGRIKRSHDTKCTSVFTPNDPTSERVSKRSPKGTPKRDDSRIKKSSLSNKKPMLANARRPRGPSPSGKVEIFPNKLAKVNDGQSDLRHCTRIQDSVHFTTFAGKFESGSLEESGSHRFRDRSPIRERGNKTGKTLTHSVRKHYVSGAKKGWGPEAGSKSEKNELLCRVPSLQDGRHIPVKRDYSERGLHGEGGSERRIFCGSDSPGPSTLPQSELETTTIPVQLSPVRVGTSPPCLYKTTETSSFISEKDRRPVDYLSGRHNSHESGQGGAFERQGFSSLVVDSLGVCNQLEEIPSSALPGDEFLGFLCELNRNDSGPATGENRHYYKQVYSNVEKEKNYGSSIGPTDRSPYSLDSGHTAGTITLPPTPNDSGQSTDHREILRDRNCLATGGAPGAPMVDSKFGEHQRQNDNDPRPGPNNRHGCVEIGLGSSFWGNPDRGSLDGGRENSAHKYTGVKRGSFCSESTSRQSETGTCPSQDGQQDSNCLYNKDGGHKVCQIAGGSSGIMGFCPSARDIHLSRIPSGRPEHGSGLGVQTHDGLQRLASEQTDVQCSVGHMGTVPVGSVCEQAQRPTGEVCQLETGPLCVGDRRFPTDMESGRHLRISPIQPHIEGTSENNKGPIDSDPDCPHLANPGVVPDTARNASGCSSVVSGRKTTVNISGSRRASAARAEKPKVSGMESLRLKAINRGLSEDAADLLSKHSWREGTTVAYNSAWGQWSGWCLPRKIDPFRASVETVINYLTERFKKGDKYRTLNNHRSAISAFHEGIDNIKMGQLEQIRRIMSAFFNARPPMPRYSYTWDVNKVLTYIKSMDSNEYLSIRDLSLKLTMLMALTSSGRSSEIHCLDIRYMTMGDQVVFKLPKLTKSRKKGQSPLTMAFSQLESDKKLCVISCLKVYLNRTKAWRKRTDSSRQQLLLSFIEPHKPIKSCSVARWLVTLLSESGIDTNVFKGHSTRSASSSKASAQGLSVCQIMEHAKWAKKSTFERHYLREVPKSSKKSETSNNAFQKLVLA